MNVNLNAHGGEKILFANILLHYHVMIKAWNDIQMLKIIKGRPANANNALSFQPKETITESFDEVEEQRVQEPEDFTKILIDIQENFKLCHNKSKKKRGGPADTNSGTNENI
ncbi:hypothetical protein BpHYR1_027116 [Brachionus plicatilis]|uniref:Uncharacterized protein n=1 Tax=Brachionus plicatilis TaxID=10195 RepID=A0A3M7QWW9_BRAPC|nr:hypothetical protein BpHYR1_027116 [Brachionus plicatilis]